MAPMTPAEKMKRRREKLKSQGKYEEYKEKHKEEMKQHRLKKKAQLETLSSKKKEEAIEKERANTKERVRKSRMMKKEAAARKGFKNNQSLGKATSRVKKVLPKSPNKRRMVIRKLFTTYLEDKKKNQTEEEKKRKTTNLSETTVNKVKEFYQREDISRQAPGMKDVMTIRNGATKEKIQIRHLLQSIKETYAMFREEYEDEEIGKSKFAELRPAYVKLSSNIPHNVCLCKYHSNFTLSLNAVCKIMPDFPVYTEDFCNLFLCSTANEKCWLNECVQCKDNFENRTRECSESIDSIHDVVSWDVWQDDSKGKFTKVTREETVGELMNHLLSLSKPFFEHVYYKRNQAKTYNEQRMQVSQDPHAALMQIDFAENYSCIAQNECQSFYWSHPQVTLFTCSLWHSQQQHPIVIVSDNNTHNKETVIPYVSRLLDELPCDQNIKFLNIWSDGPSSQFKNKFVAATIPALQKHHNMKITWNYFATSHGKGPVDGIGGSVKRQVRNEVIKKDETVLNAFQFVKVCQKVSKVKLIHMTDDDINEKNQQLHANVVFENAPVVKGIKKIHAIEYRNEKMITRTLSKNIETPNPHEERRSVYRLVYTSDSDVDGDLDNLEDIPKIDTLSIKHGSFVKVQFPVENLPDTFHTYAAVCQSALDSQGEVKVMCLSSTMQNGQQLFRLNTDEEEPHVKLDQIVEILPDADFHMAGKFRMYYKFPKFVTVNEKK